ncbi:MAG: TIGR03619 family F420-dependent LLM class oxidoreductase [Gammaproteobacteria bacterium]|jgi:probable F420-dependent oxidoreductase|nr:TIGR03619 family F420-dependent LLM class oxidoreductase [Gammaproteobacteria bacterium]
MDIGFLMIATTQSGDLAAIARRAEEIGFDSFWIPEHPIIPRGEHTPYPFGGPLPEHYGRWSDPFIALTVAAAATTRIKLATGICLLPEREPMVTAKVIASLDYYSGGRVILGIGAGWLKEETEIMGANFGSRWQRTREMTEAMRVLWTEENASYQGKHINFPPVRSEPKPVQAGGPPVLLGGHGEKSLQRIAKNYDGWCPLVNDPVEFAREAAELKEMFRSEGRDPSKLILSPFVDPENGKLSDAALKAFRDAGAHRLVMFYSQQTHELADGAAPLMERVANIVERARAL